MKATFFYAAAALLVCIILVACTLHSRTGCAATELARIMTARSESSCKARRRGDAEASAMRRNAAGGFRTCRPDGAAALCGALRSARLPVSSDTRNRTRLDHHKHRLAHDASQFCCGTLIENDTVAIKDPSPVEADIIKAHMGNQAADEPAKAAAQPTQPAVTNQATIGSQD